MSNSGGCQHAGATTRSTGRGCVGDTRWGGTGRAVARLTARAMSAKNSCCPVRAATDRSTRVLLCGPATSVACL